MYVKLSPRNLNPGPYPPHPTSTYTCEVTITSMVHGSYNLMIIYYVLPSFNLLTCNTLHTNIFLFFGAIINTIKYIIKHLFLSLIISGLIINILSSLKRNL